ncbi:PDR6 [Candida oxycetoniae]|uniref:PDR6 n=1 Tax=Candida oxycetoniae TaxID=497107 RepID=A0AAI9ST20_9ASCO|nr:PDR6 [Candida oxycetoniae]KAI3402379.2 PDR6 [Candida oxycetoniae]
MSSQSCIDDVIRDIEILYTSKDTSQIESIQQKLQTYQKSSQGYQLGLELLHNDNSTVKYFGALTITVYFNTFPSESDYLHPFQQLSTIVNQLTIENFHANAFIIKKLLSCLSLIYAQNYTSFDPVLLFIGTMKNKSSTTLEDLLENLDTPIKLELLITFFQIFIEDILKYSNKVSELHQIVHKSVFIHVRTLFQYLLTRYSNLPIDILLLSIDCLNAWIVYISSAESQSEVRYTDDLSIFITFTLKPLGGGGGSGGGGDGDKSDGFLDKIEIYNKSFSALSEFVDNIPRVLNPFKAEILSIFFGNDEFGLTFLNTVFSNKDILEENQAEIDNYINLIVNYLTLYLVQIVRNLLDDDTYRIIETMITLTNAPGMAIAEENISSQLTSFWDDFANTLIDDEDALAEILTNPTAKEAYGQRKNVILMEVAIVYFKKIQRPSNKPTTQEFIRFRTLAADLFILFYTILGLPLFTTLCDIVGPNLMETEAAIYLVYKITSDLQFYDDDEEEEGVDENSKTSALIKDIKTIFDRNVLSLVNSNEADQQLTTSLLNLMSNLTFFYKSPTGKQYLASSFDFLFKLVTNQPKGNLSLVASRTISRICKNTGEEFLPQLEAILIAMLRNPAIDNFIRERITFSYISVVKSSKNPVELATKIRAILFEIEQHTLHLNVPEGLEDYTVSLIACISEIGKACVYPEPIENHLTSFQIREITNYWNEDPLGIKLTILTNLKHFSLDSPFLSQKTIVTEICCNILKSGFNEPLPGPFTFDLESILQYIIAKVQISTPASIEFLHSLLISTVLTHAKDLSQSQIELVLSSVFVNVVEIILSDIDLIKTSLEVSTIILDLNPRLLLHTNIFPNCILPFALKSFEKHEVSITRALVSFWDVLLKLKKGSQQDQLFVRQLMVEEDKQNPLSSSSSSSFSLSVSSSAGASSSSSSSSMGLRLCESLLKAFVLSPRSSLDHYYSLFRTLIAKYPMEFKKWLIHTASNLQVGKVRFTESEIQQFVNKLMVTRGQRMANTILKEYWLKINKLVEF